MGGGDLNCKKTWHPSTLKNQERVWKAEQAAAEEKKRILELQRERAQERDRDELNDLARQNARSGAPNDDRLHWMYDKPDKKIQQEDYLLGKAIEKNYETAGKSEQNEIPAVSRRVVGSSMLSAASDTQVDLARKLREDPLLLVKERERAARAALLNNPVQRRKLAELLRKEQEQKNQSKVGKKSKKKDKELDNLLAAKLNALGAKKGMNIAELLQSDDSSSDSSSEEEKTKKKKKKKKKKKSKQKSKKRDHESDSESPDTSKKNREDEKKIKRKHKPGDGEVEPTTRGMKYNNSSKYEESDTLRKRKSKDNDSEEYNHYKKRRDYSPYREHKHRPRDSSKDRRDIRRNMDGERNRNKLNEGDRRDSKKQGLSEEEKMARLAEMAAAGAEREVQRGRRVAKQLVENEIAEKSSSHRRPMQNEARALPDSLESRIHSNRHYIQRDQRHMNEHFARR